MLGLVWGPGMGNQYLYTFLRLVDPHLLADFQALSVANQKSLHFVSSQVLDVVVIVQNTVVEELCVIPRYSSEVFAKLISKVFVYASSNVHCSLVYVHGLFPNLSMTREGSGNDKKGVG